MFTVIMYPDAIAMKKVPQIVIASAVTWEKKQNNSINREKVNRIRITRGIWNSKLIGKL